MLQPIVGFDLDEQFQPIAILACGHRQHVRHNPPMMARPWVLTSEGRAGMIGRTLNCVKCDEPAISTNASSGD